MGRVADLRPRLGIDPELVPRTGKISRAGLLVTRTLLFAGEGATGGPILRALDKATGETLAEIALPVLSLSNPEPEARP